MTSSVVGPDAHATEGLTCAECARPLTWTGVGRPRRFCSAACRSRAYRGRQHSRRTHAKTSDRQDREAPDPTTTRVAAIVRAAVAVADVAGAEALSMRRVAAELGVPVMSLYRHVPSKEGLIDLVVEAVLNAQPLPEPVPSAWRDALTLSARHEWQLYRGRPWLVPFVAATDRPPISIGLMRLTDWRLRALTRHGLPLDRALQVVMGLAAHVLGCAVMVQAAPSAAEPRGEGREDRHAMLLAALSSGQLPMVSQFGRAEYAASRPDAVFEFGLQRYLDGVATLFEGRRDDDAPDRSRGRARR